ncbi:MAG TPA: 1,4-alpha-glucan-branching enzyme, partial [Phaeodactylibacter sp.]|nr:1,4-alpha-glucan-branching enzyme [Phaeodactylibacter sp.]
ASFHHYLGFFYDKKKAGWYYREWAPAAEALFLIGDFNDWNTESHPMYQKGEGIWEIFLPDVNGTPQLQHQQLIKVRIHSNGVARNRVPVYITRVLQDSETYLFAGQIWNPSHAFEWTDQDFVFEKNTPPLIYECHVGMAQEKEGVGTYLEFAENILPRIHRLGYNCIQMMAIQEHPYYGSFGYHVSNYFAPSSRFGTPEDLKYLINKAHQLGIAVILDVVHSHAVKNIEDGLNDFDGSKKQYFHEGGRGHHPSWDSKLFDYGKNEVRRFLLSNVNYWMTEFHVDGFRFDGVTSMLYHHHGHFVSFNHYDKYFREGVDWDALIYVQLANQFIHELNPNALSIAEDMSGMPGLCQRNEDGGLGFDYRLGMGIPDFWIKLLKHSKDEDWNIYQVWDVLNNRRWKEKTIAYAESHDQAMVGDKTLAFWLMDKEMYFHMIKTDTDWVIERGIALHKMIRLVTISLGGEGYLNFIGNEFGHPEWIDFPRKGNDWSYKYARRQWSLVDNSDLKYEWLNDFDAAMIHLFSKNKILQDSTAQQLNMDTTNHVMIFEKKGFLFLFNFHPVHSIPNYKFNLPKKGTYQIVLNSDHPKFGGHGRIDESVIFESFLENEMETLQVYLPNRTSIVLERLTASKN